MSRLGGCGRQVGRPAFIATTGGHLVEMDVLAPLLEPERHHQGIWVTHLKAQSASLLHGRETVFVPFINARDWRVVLRQSPSIALKLRRLGVDRIYSTGAAIALATLPLAGLARTHPTYIESIARPHGPSLTGKILAKIPWVAVQTQYKSNATKRWRFDTSLLDSYEVEVGSSPSAIDTVFVTVGTARPWSFDRLIESVRRVVPEEVRVIWQAGASIDHLGGEDVDIHDEVDEAQFRYLIQHADVVISHGGAGNLLSCLEAGRVPVIIPRRVKFHEHVDDHQVDLVHEASQRSLAVGVEADMLSWQDLQNAASRKVTRAPR